MRLCARVSNANSPNSPGLERSSCTTPTIRARPDSSANPIRVEYARSLQANAVAPLVLGEMFLRVVQPGYESGLVLMSSAAARHPFAGNAGYCAAKAGVEMWVRTVRRELKARNRKTWVIAVRPGFVDTPTTRSIASLAASEYPVAPQMARQFETGQGVLSPDEAGRDIWAALPPRTDESVLLFGEMVQDAASPKA